MDPTGDSPLYEQIRTRLTERIAKGEWRPGDQIPSEAELARTFSVAIGTLRKAIDALVAERVLVRQQGRGTFVTVREGGGLYFHFFHIACLTGRRVLPEVRTVAFQRDRADRATAEALHIIPYDKVIRIRNVLSLDGRPRIIDDIVIASELFPGMTEKSFVARNTTIYQLYQRKFGINVLHTDERLRAVLADAQFARLLRVGLGTPLLHIRRVALTFRDRPVELRVSHVDTSEHHYQNMLDKEFVS